MKSRWWDDHAKGEDKFEEQRLRMVEKQIERRGIKDQRILEAMRAVPRHLFVPEQFQENAYEDSPVTIGFEQTISQPFIVAYMLATLELTGVERVLEIGAGSGYEAALLSHLCDEVYSIEIIPELAMRAQKLFEALSCENVQVKCGDGYKGWPDRAPFDRIVLSAAPNHIPAMLVNQLKAPGRMILPMGDRDQRLVLLDKDKDGTVKRKDSVRVRFVPMTGIASNLN